MIVFDTDTCIEILRGNSAVIERRTSFPDEVAVSFMSVAELFYGVHRSARSEKNRVTLETFLMTVTVIESDNQIVRRFGELKAALTARGTNVADADLLIAATAIEHGGVLVTGNTRHFELIPGLELQDWRSEP